MGFGLGTRKTPTKQGRDEMKFEAEMKLTYRQLLALYTVSEKLFRRKQMLLFRLLRLL